jgi:outer membrane protein
MPRNQIKFTLALALGLVASIAPPAFAQASPGKIGILSLQDAIFATNEGKKESEDLEKRATPKREEIKRRTDEIESLKQQLQTAADKLSAEERKTQASAIDLKLKALQRDTDNAQTDYQQSAQEIVNRVGNRLVTVIEKYAKDNGYVLVLDVSAAQSPVLWATPAANITREIVDAYNAQFSAGAPAAPKTPATATPKKP